MAFARKRHAQLITAREARRPHEALPEVVADAEAREFVLHERRQPVTLLIEAREQARQVAPNKHDRVTVVGLARDVDARPRAWCPPQHLHDHARLLSKSAKIALGLHGDGSLTRPAGGPPRSVCGSPGEHRQARRMLLSAQAHPSSKHTTLVVAARLQASPPALQDVGRILRGLGTRGS